MNNETNQQAELKKSCKNCGAELVYLPGTNSVTCEYCGHQEDIQQEEKQVLEIDLRPYLDKVGDHKHTQQISMIQCKNCGATQHIEETYKSLNCVYCSNVLMVEDNYTEEWITPGALVPFQLTQNESHRIFSKWIKKLWFAPNKLKKASLDINSTKGVYVPYWTFDAELYAIYSGERGEYYYVNQTYTDSDGKRQTRKVRKTRWYKARGSVQTFIDDTLVKASYPQKTTIPKKISNWNLDKLTPFHNDYLAGFITEKYSIPLKDGHLEAIDVAEQTAKMLARRDIGGDDQRVHSVHMNLTEETFKHILLPVFISSYQYKGKVYHFYVNGQTGNIHGKRPYSPMKIIFTVLVVLLVVVLIAFFSGAK